MLSIDPSCARGSQCIGGIGFFELVLEPVERGEEHSARNLGNGTKPSLYVRTYSFWLADTTRLMDCGKALGPFCQILWKAINSKARVRSLGMYKNVHTLQYTFSEQEEKKEDFLRPSNSVCVLRNSASCDRQTDTVSVYLPAGYKNEDGGRKYIYSFIPSPVYVPSFIPVQKRKRWIYSRRETSEGDEEIQ